MGQARLADFSLEKFQRVNQILDDNPLIKADLPKRYIRTLHYIINAQIELRDLESARKNIAVMRSLPGTEGFMGQNIASQVFVASYLSELRLLGPLRRACAFHHPGRYDHRRNGIHGGPAA
jgi:hypothetical protein